MSTDIETIREALSFNKNYLLTKHNMGSEQCAKVRLECSHMLTEATIALDRIEGRCLPEMPEGYRITQLMQSAATKNWACKIYKPPYDSIPRSYGSTPSAAVQSALSKIGSQS